MPNLILVMLGGAVGSAMRYQVGRFALQQVGPGFPWGTLAVNLIGGLIMGLMAGMFMNHGSAERPLWLLLVVGLLGGFTTFSAFSLDLFMMIDRGEAFAASAYLAVSVAGSLALLAIGYSLTRAAA